MVRFLLSLLMIILTLFQVQAQQYGWTNIGSRLPNTPSTATISDIDMVGDSMWVTSGYGTYLNQVPGEIYFSADRGATWSIQSTLYGTHAICMQNSLKGWCGGVEGQIYRTLDGGLFWERKFSLGNTLLDIDFPPGCDTGMCTGFSGKVKYITPTGLITVSTFGYVSNISSVSCIDRNHAFVAGEEIIGPVVNGIFLINQSYPGTNGIYAIDMLDSLNGWCVGSPTAAGSYDSTGCMIIHTTDGQNWTEQVNPVPGKSGTLMAVKALNNQEVWACGTSGVVLHTTDGGQNWVREASGLTTEMLYGIHIVNNQEVYITGNNRTLLRYGLINSIEENTETGLRLFPNPAADYANIQLPGQMQAEQVSILDLSGRMLKTIVLAADQRVELSGISPGFYLIRVKAGSKVLSSRFAVK